MNTELLARIIRDEFDKPSDYFWRTEYQYDLIELAKDLNLNELANEMEKDLL